MTKTDLPDLNEATRAAVAALAHRVRERDALDDRPDADLFATEFLTALRGQGWRPTAARPSQPWTEQIGPPPRPETARRGADLARAALRGEEVS
ncbi:hypothetical protein E1286_05000 [Nonomuraea terrae]|uniref:Uncharacterized protein n=1 Tax=Nonomuraea terrae TaxID=2530383 RepID=A0A4R4Z8D2_9ACTN|nr:hypothetical protein [Nonomuraea terrae]TDD54551.1 hypothetical protein E1286_05000 [Nonomuraea terrae]